jgi:hypothetical protein
VRRHTLFTIFQVLMLDLGRGDSNRYVFIACVHADDERLRLSEEWSRRTPGSSSPGAVQHHIRRADVALHQFDAKTYIEYRTSQGFFFHENLTSGGQMKSW